MSHLYRLATLKLASSIELPGLPPWAGPRNSPPDLVFRLGPTPEQRQPADGAAMRSDRGDPDRFFLNLPGLCGVSIANGREIVVAAEAGADPAEIGAVLTGPLQAVLWHQRGLLPLHAVAVAAAGRAVALAGPSGAGKSTLGAVLAARGHAVLADDVCVIRISDDGAFAMPGFPRLRLWRDALDHFGVATGRLRPLLPGKRKFIVDSPDGALRNPQILSAVVLLHRTAKDPVAIERLFGARAFAALIEVVHMRRPAHTLGRDAAIFAALTKMIETGVMVWRLTLPDDFEAVTEAAAMVIGAVETGTGSEKPAGRGVEASN